MPFWRRGRGQRYFRAGSILVLAFLIGYMTSFLFSSQTFLRLENDETHAPLFWIPVKGNESFSLGFRHSYDKAMYIGNFRLAGNEIIFTGITFQSDLNGQGFITTKHVVIEEGWGKIQGLHIKMASIPFLMGSPDEANHTLVIHNRTYFLTRYVEPGTPVAFRVVKGEKLDAGLWRIETWMN